MEGMDLLFMNRNPPPAASEHVSTRPQGSTRQDLARPGRARLYLHLGHILDAFIQSDLQKVHLSEERETTIYLFLYSVYEAPKH